MGVKVRNNLAKEIIADGYAYMVGDFSVKSP
jgi:hypothetical protein